MIGHKYRIRYYSPAALEKRVHEAILTLLPEIRSRHGIATEIESVRLIPSPLSAAILVPDQDHQKEFYDRDFLPQWRLLNARTGMSVRKILRSRRGGHFVAGVVAIVSDQGVEWYSVPGDRFSEYDQDHRLGFLKTLLVQGPALLEDLCGPERAAA